VNDRRPFLNAFVLAVPAALGTWFVAHFVYVLVSSGPGRAIGLVPYMLLGAVLFGLPAVIAVIGVVAFPAFLLLRRASRITMASTLAAGAACGLLLRESVALLWAEPELSYVPVPVALAAGLGAALAWWSSWDRRRERSPMGRGTI